MQPGIQRSRRLFGWVILPLIGLLVWLLNARAASWPPKIDYVEPFHGWLLIHFETAPNYAYVVEYTEMINTNGQAGPYWTNLYFAPSLPFEDHYVVVDTNVPFAKHRFYRLRAFR